MSKARINGMSVEEFCNTPRRQKVGMEELIQQFLQEVLKQMKESKNKPSAPTAPAPTWSECVKIDNIHIENLKVIINK